MTETIFRDATIVTPGSVIERGSLVVRDGRIASILPPPDWRHLAPGAVVIEARDRLLLPGLVDLHNDGIEQELEPRPRAEFPLAVALHSLENRLVSHGITTIFHSFSFMDGRDGSLTPARLEPTIRDLCRLRATGSIRHLVHARYEIVETRHVEALARLIDEGALNLVSFMDHTPGQGQYTDPTHLVSYFMRKYGASAADIDALLRERERKARDPGIPLALSRLAARTREAGLPIASHDDDTPAKVGKMRELGATISEFPVSLEAATAARRAGMHVTVGAPNVLRGGSTTDNLSALDAVRAGTVDALCSDYFAPALLPAALRIARDGLATLPEAIRMVTLAPARAAGLAAEIGSLEPGKRADIVLVSEASGMPVVVGAWVGGHKVLEKHDGGREPLGGGWARDLVVRGEEVHGERRVRV